MRASGEGHRAFEAAKHIYDLAVLERHPSILSLEKNETLMKQLLNIRMEEEKERHDGIPYVAPNQFRFLKMRLRMSLSAMPIPRCNGSMF